MLKRAAKGHHARPSRAAPTPALDIPSAPLNFTLQNLPLHFLYFMLIFLHANKPHGKAIWQVAGS